MLLGSHDSLDISNFNGQNLYFGIQVQSDPEMIPRQQIVSVGYALTAQTLKGDAVSVDDSGDVNAFNDLNVSGTTNLLGSVSMEGPVGIGTTGPIAELDVNGGIRTRYSGSTVIDTLSPNSLNTIVHNLGITKCYVVFATNGHWEANQFGIDSVRRIDGNSFKFYARGGYAQRARINWIIFVVNEPTLD